ncbi:helix-turn-helix domain-containing protein [Salmonella enterica]|uniref:helix-turn-helix domain-containing protein n=1 Tax=Salmonella enterica TaxID=28901 RepID=UPI000D0BBED8
MPAFEWVHVQLHQQKGMISLSPPTICNSAGLAAALRRGRKGGRPPAIDAEKVDQILAALEGGASKASVCRAFSVPRSTLTDTLRRIGWAGPGGRNLTTDQSNVISRR